MIIRSFRKEDILSIQNAIEPEYSCTANYDMCRAVFSLSATMEDNGTPVLCGGINIDENDDNVCWIWCIVANPVKNKVKLYRTLIEGLKIVIAESGCGIVKTLVLKDFEKGERLARHAGFKPTGAVEEMNGLAYLEYQWHN